MSSENMDVNNVGALPDVGGDYNFNMPSIEEVMKLIEKMEGISPEERESIRADLLQQTAGAQEMVKEQLLAAQGHSSSDYMVFVSMLMLIALIFGLFGYKLYKFLNEKEQRKMEKVKAKQSKKKQK